MSKDLDRSAGFTLVEVTIVMALTVPLLLMIGGAGRAAMGSFHASEKAARTTQIVLRSLDQIERALRSGEQTSVQTVATRDDVRARLAENEGDWFSMPAGSPRTMFQVESIVGDPDGLALRFPTIHHRFEFILDGAETANGADDDGDGLVDEGALRLTRDGQVLTLVDDLEGCQFEFSAEGAMRITLRYVRPGHGQQLVRSSLDHTVMLNNP